MPDAIPKMTADHAAYGYKQLPGLGPGGGNEFRNIVYGGMGVALGIVVGTMLASSPLHFSSPAHAQAKTHAVAAVAASTTTAKTAEMPQAEAKTPPPTTVGSAEKPSPLKTEAKTAPVTAASALVLEKPKPAERSRPEHPAPTRVSSHEGKQHTLHHVARAHRRHRTHRRFLRRHLHPKEHSEAKHPVQEQHFEAVRQQNPIEDKPSPPRPVKETFLFTIEGDVTAAGFDAPSGMIETFEGESFRLGGPVQADGSLAALAGPTAIHYRCDQTGSCSLKLPNGVILSARRFTGLQ